MHSFLNEVNQVSLAPLSGEFPLLDIDNLNSNEWTKSNHSIEVYVDTWSEWMITFLALFLLFQAFNKLLDAICWSNEFERTQLTTYSLNKSLTIDRYLFPLLDGMKVIFVTHFWFNLSALKFLFRIFGYLNGPDWL